MANYVSWMKTEELFVMKDPAAFREALATLVRLGAPISTDWESYRGCGELMIWEDEPGAWWVGGDDTSFELMWEDGMDLVESRAVPPENWKPEEREGYQAAFGVPEWLPKIMNEEMIELDAFLQMHMKEDCVAVVFHAGHEKLCDVDGYVQVITHDDIKGRNLYDVAKELKAQLEEERGK
jgi:hypothetical protein